MCKQYSTEKRIFQNQLSSRNNNTLAKKITTKEVVVRAKIIQREDKVETLLKKRVQSSLINIIITSIKVMPKLLNLIHY